MARRKRASLKDKSPEKLGLTQKRGKGLDVLFGGPLNREETRSTSPRSRSNLAESSVTNQPESEVENMPNEDNTKLSSLSNNAAPAPPPVPPIAADASQRNVDEFGLPIAMNSPPADLVPPNDAQSVDELGLPIAMNSPPADLATSGDMQEVDEFGFPVAMEGPPSDLTLPVPVASPPAEMAASTVDSTGDMSGLAGNEFDLAANDNLSNVTTNDDLSGLAMENDDLPLASENLSESAMDTMPSANPMPLPPSPTAAPFDIPPTPTVPSSEPAFTSPSPSTSTPVEPLPPPVSTPSYVPYSTTASSLPSSTPSPVPYTPPPPSPPAMIESFGGIVTQGGPVSAQDLVPADTRYAPATHIIGIEESPEVTQDEAITNKIVSYLGQDRIRKLDQDIEDLYRQVEDKLSVLGEDAKFALKTLRAAQDILLEDPRQYDEALYRVAVVRTMINRKRNLENWSWKWGLYIFFYALFWLVIFSAGFLATDFLRELINTNLTGSSGPSAELDAIRAAWFSALAGGLGGIIDVMWSLYWRVSIKQNFDPQYLMYYLVKPIMGFFLGALVYFISGAGFFITNVTESLPPEQVIALQIVLGWIAGFRQEFVFSMIHKIVKSVSPEKPDEEPVSLAPPDDTDTITRPSA